MFKSKTVFVLGAGASNEVGMPLGSILAERISNLLRFVEDDYPSATGRPSISSFFQRYIGDLRVGREISKGIRFSNSIDEYIDRRKDLNVARTGKLAIAHEILVAEAASGLNYYYRYSDGDVLATTEIGGSWYLHLARMLFRPNDTTALDRLFARLSFIDFNYDRCLEQFFRYALKDAYSIDRFRADELLRTLALHKPYGSLGPMPMAGRPNGVAFGCDPYLPDMNSIVKGIKTYTEQVDTDAADRIKEEFASAHTVVFLGFGFHEQNMRLLTPKGDTRIKRVLATAKGLSDNDIRIIQGAIVNMCKSASLKRPERVIVRDLTCAELFQEYRLTLQAA
jgi:hypothetical protein